MTLRTLEVFIKVAECGKMSTAAKILYVSQSSVSQAITEIEKEYGVLLFERVRKRLVLTPVGQQLLEYAKQAVAYQNSVEDWLKQCSTHKYLNIGATVTVGSSIISDIIKQLKEQYPELEPWVFVGNTQLVEDKLVNNELDVALVEGNITSKAVDSETVMDDYMVIICGKDHRFFGRESVSIEELGGETFILREHGSGTRAQITELLEENQIPYKAGWECHNAESIKQAVIEGLGISAISERLVHRECSNGLLWACNIEGLSLKRHFSLAVPKDKIATDVLESFRDIVSRYAEKERQERRVDEHTHLVN